MVGEIKAHKSGEEEQSFNPRAFYPSGSDTFLISLIGESFYGLQRETVSLNKEATLFTID
jgi:hypothetical protein